MCPWNTWKNTEYCINDIFGVEPSCYIYYYYSAVCMAGIRNAARLFDPEVSDFRSVKPNSNTGSVFVSQRVAFETFIVVRLLLFLCCSINLRNNRFHWLHMHACVCPRPNPCWWCRECVLVIVVITPQSLHACVCVCRGSSYSPVWQLGQIFPYGYGEASQWEKVAS